MTTATTTSQAPVRPVQRVAKELVASSGFLLARLGFAFKGRAIERIEQEGFEGHHYSVLAMLGEGSRETQGTIAEALDVDPSRLVAVLDGLEERELIVRQRDPQDRRRHVVSITPAGRRQLQRLRSIAKELEGEFFAAFSPEERATFHELLGKLACQHDPRCGFAPTVSSAPDQG
jgi:MarR family transcriptional regulator, lower aerobic nicotinate degradation pathway regulator